jgi:hypothetical protein
MTQAFNLSQFANKVDTSGQASLTTAVTGTLPVANGGTGATTLTSGNVLIGAGTSAVTLVAAGTSGNVLTSNGTTWTSAASSGGQLQTEVFTAPGTWTKPASATQVRVTVVGGGGGSGNVNNAGVSGSSSSFGPAVSATGGVRGVGSAGVPGTGTVSVGTLLRTTHAGATTHDIVDGLDAPITSTTTAFSTTGNLRAGRGGGRGYNDANALASPISPGGNGGVAIAIVPVSAPVSITVGSGGNSAALAGQAAGIGGAIVVEFIG